MSGSQCVCKSLVGTNVSATNVYCWNSHIKCTETMQQSIADNQRRVHVTTQASSIITMYTHIYTRYNTTMQKQHNMPYFSEHNSCNILLCCGLYFLAAYLSTLSTAKTAVLLHVACRCHDMPSGVWVLSLCYLYAMFAVDFLMVCLAL